MRVCERNSKNFKSWVEDVKLDIRLNNIKLKGWHDTNMYNFKIWWTKVSCCGNPKFKEVSTVSPQNTIVKAYPVKELKEEIIQKKNS